MSNWAEVSRELATLLDTHEQRRFPGLRTIILFWRTCWRHAFTRWDSDETKANVIGYLVAAAIAIAALIFGFDPSDPRLQSMAFRIIGGLSIGLVCWWFVLYVVVTPARLWHEQQRSIIALLGAIQDMRDLEATIRAIRDVQADGISLLGDIHGGGALPLDDGKAWMGRMREAIWGAGDRYQAKYQSTTANMSLVTNTHAELVAGMITLATDVITDLSAEHATLRERARQARV